MLTRVAIITVLRKIVSWSMADNIKVSLVNDALSMAIHKQTF